MAASPEYRYFLRAGRCLACHKSCLRCGGEGKDNCLECAEKNAVLHDGRCLSHCPPSFFATSAAQLRICRPCAPHCASCSSAATGQCSHCLPGAQLIAASGQPHGSCKPKCPPGRFLAGHACESCPPQCRECETRHSCLRCDNGTLLAVGTCLASCPEGQGAEEGRCGVCPMVNCSRCTGPGLTKCLKCRAPLSLDVTGKCSEGPLCPLGEFRQSEKCLKCHSICRSCYGPSASNCLSCSLDSCLSGSLCRPCCSSNTASSSSSSSSLSSVSCKNCSLTPDQPCLESLTMQSPGLLTKLTPAMRIVVIVLTVLVILLVVCYLFFFGVFRSVLGPFHSLCGSCCERGLRYDPLPQNSAGSPSRTNLEDVDDIDVEEKGEKTKEEEIDSLDWTVSINSETVTVRWPNGYALMSSGDKNSDVSSGVGSSPDKSTDEAAEEGTTNDV